MEVCQGVSRLEGNRLIGAVCLFVSATSLLEIVPNTRTAILSSKQNAQP